METKDILLALRKKLGLTQDEFAEKLLLTRQAVSRWENGETVPKTDTLKLISETFHVSVDYLLGRPPVLCQSCGMPIYEDSERGTEEDGSLSKEYCTYCYQHGTFTQDVTMEEMVEHNLQFLDQWNESAGLHLTKEEARESLLQFLPSLNRWKAVQ